MQIMGRCRLTAVVWLCLAGCMLHADARTVTAVDTTVTVGTESTKEGDCFYNGTWYKLGEELPTRGSCLMCRCIEGFTEPGPMTCAIIDCPWGPNAGCRTIYKEGECCPEFVDCPSSTPTPVSAEHGHHDDDENEKEEEALESRLFKTCECDDRYLAHYEAMKCQPVFIEGCRCPVKFDCPGRFFTGNSTSCVYKDATYNEGDSIDMGNPCLMCTCRPTDPMSSVSCIGIECGEMFGRPNLGPGCYFKYAEGKCCSTGKSCPPVDGDASEPAPTCEYNGKVYQVGQHIYSDDLLCTQCLCTENWTGPDGPGCTRIQCDIERNLEKLWQGCIPIYHEKTCCPIEYHCPGSYTGTVVSSEVETPSPTTESPDGAEAKCHFGGREYTLGTNVDIKHPTNCVICRCTTPPYLTCVHRSCPRPPNDDYENCTAKYERGACCAEYECNYGAHGDKVAGADTTLIGPPPIENMCKEKQCNDGEECMLQQNNCESDKPCPLFPVCVKINPNCPTPACAPGCVVTIADIDSCPTCSCNVVAPSVEPSVRSASPSKAIVEASPGEYPCPMPMCKGFRCQLVTGDDGCETCSCESPCEPPECSEPCEPEKDVPKGHCPGCICPVDIVTETLPPSEK